MPAPRRAMRASVAGSKAGAVGVSGVVVDAIGCGMKCSGSSGGVSSPSSRALPLAQALSPLTCAATHAALAASRGGARASPNAGSRPNPSTNPRAQPRYLRASASEQPRHAWLARGASSQWGASLSAASSGVLLARPGKGFWPPPLEPDLAFLQWGPGSTHVMNTSPLSSSKTSCALLAAPIWASMRDWPRACATSWLSMKQPTRYMRSCEGPHS